MNKILSLFLDRLAERLTALQAGLFSSWLEGLHAEAQADQQSRLEDLARAYEAEGKADIAVTLRKRAAAIPSADLAGEAVEAIERLTGEPKALTSQDSNSPAEIRGLPDFSSPPKTSRKKRRGSATPNEQAND